MTSFSNSKLLSVEDFNEQIECFHLSEYEWCCNLIAVVLPKKIVLGVLKHKDEEKEEVIFQKLEEIYHADVSNYIVISPETTTSSLPASVIFAVAYMNFDIRIYKSNFDDNNTVEILSGHRNFINALAWHPDGHYLASVSDDKTCIVWDMHDKNKKKSIFYLRFAGISVKWHPDCDDKLLVADKGGLIRSYNFKTEQVVLSFETKTSPLMSLDWAFGNNALIATLAAGEFNLWNLQKTFAPLISKQIFENCGIAVKFSPINQNIIAAAGGPNTLLKIFCTKTNVVLLETQVKIFGGLCWHYNLPLLITAQDRKLQFWKIN